MEKYYWTSDNGNTFSLFIGDISDRFDGEGIYQPVELSYQNNHLGWVIYETTYGRQHAYDHIKNITLDNYNDFYGNLEFYMDKYNLKKFKEWTLDSLEPIESKRRNKVAKIKSNILC